VSAALVALAMLATLNPARVPLGLPDAPTRTRLSLLAAASVAALLLATAGLAAADPLLDALDVSPESLRIAAGIVLVAGGLRSLVAPRPASDPGLAGRLAAIVPVLFPLLLTPELALVVLSAGADERGLAALGGLAVAVGLAAAFSVVRRTPVAEALLLAAARLLGALLVLAGVAYVVDGIRDV
jgi:small neutral amino acid transporter SnatA (MarC family)